MRSTSKRLRELWEVPNHQCFSHDVASRMPRHGDEARRQAPIGRSSASLWQVWQERPAQRPEGNVTSPQGGGAMDDERLRRQEHGRREDATVTHDVADSVFLGCPVGEGDFSPSRKGTKADRDAPAPS